jgi:hypothetical protein
LETTNSAALDMGAGGGAPPYGAGDDGEAPAAAAEYARGVERRASRAVRGSSAMASVAR